MLWLPSSPGLCQAPWGPLRERYLSTVRARNDRKTVRERVAAMDTAVAHMIRKWAKHAAKFHEVSLRAILPGEVTVNGGIVAIAAGGAQADGETPESSSAAPELAAA